MSIYWVKEKRIFFFFYSSGIWLNSGQYICNILNKLLHILLSLLFALWPERDSKNRKLVKNRLYPEVMSSVLTHSLQHVETFSYLELVTSRGDVNFVALHNVHFGYYVYLPTEQAETYLKSRVLINYSTHICLCLFGWKVNMILKETMTFKL